MVGSCDPSFYDEFFHCGHRTKIKLEFFGSRQLVFKLKKSLEKMRDFFCTFEEIP